MSTEPWKLRIAVALRRSGASHGWIADQLQMGRSNALRTHVSNQPSTHHNTVAQTKHDSMVAADDNLEGIRAGLVAGGNEAVTIHRLPGLNHLFQQCSTGAISEYGSIDETFKPAALQIVSDWIVSTVRNS